MSRKKLAVRSVTPFLWFDQEAHEAAEFYASLFKGSRVVSRNAMGCEFIVAGQRLMALNGGPVYELTPAFSLLARVKTQQEIDDLWARLLANGGEESRCGWLVDKFGVSWQVIPDRLTQLLAHQDPKIAEAAAGAMMKMTKIEIAELDAAVAAVARPRARATRRGGR